ncbi:MAG: ATP-binding protein [Syntrophobacteraceae bacterium]|jgi:DNA replication protein DnaC
MNCHGLSSRHFIGGTGTGKTHLAVTIGFRAFRSGARAGFWNHVDPGNQLEQEKMGLPANAYLDSLHAKPRFLTSKNAKKR